MTERGFTLLELLLATTVLGVVMAMLTLSLNATLRVVEGTERQEAVYALAQTAMRRLAEDLTATVPVKESPFVGQKQTWREQRADSLTFVSQAHLVFNPEKQPAGVASIRYLVQADPADERKLRLLRSDTLLLPGVPLVQGLAREDVREQAFLLADGLRSVRFRYIDQEGQETDSWQEQAQSEGEEEVGAVPAAVHCTLEFWLDPDKDLYQSFGTRILLPVEAEDAS